MNIEVRIVYVVDNPHPLRLSPVCLMYWNGEQFQYFVDTSKLALDFNFRQLVEKVLESKCKQAKANSLVNSEDRPKSLSDLLFVREGLGSGIYYGNVKKYDESYSFEKAKEDWNNG